MDLESIKMMLQLAFVLYITATAGYLCYLFNQKDRIQKVSFFLLALAVLIHLGAVVSLTSAIKALPINNLVQSLSMAALALGIMFLIVQYRFNLKILGLFASAVLTLTMLGVMVIPDTPVAPDRLLKGFWLYSHIVLVFTGEAALALAAGAGLLYLIQEKGIKGKNPGFFFSRLPSLDFLDSVSYACIGTGFALLTFGLVTGFIYAKSVWGVFWSWDIKELFSVGTWLLYAAILHFRFYSGWRGRRSAIMTLAGFLVIVFTFLGVNIFLGGHHQGFTK
ncbi:cytochrome c biogenesis protein CcsA [Desulfospira joergensenii]|uniref:cytochrome c biogenesis protein CcsA n=1 Tax=Desulfospira joergensenii TaxID=53329 RepID=UPI0003B61A5D|nr:cytochrome c biogenesis protein CcsA [Desulfospira joergensenii]